MPFELYELVRKPTALEAAGIAVNAAVVAYLVVIVRRRLAREHARTASAAATATAAP